LGKFFGSQRSAEINKGKKSSFLCNIKLFWEFYFKEFSPEINTIRYAIVCNEGGEGELGDYRKISKE